jgi:hypothetical protein
MSFLKEPKLFKSNNGVASSDFQVELSWLLVKQSAVSCWKTYDLLQFLQVKDIRLLSMRPAQKRSEVHQAGSENSLLVLE